MLTCQEITELVTEFLEGRMTAEQRLRFQKHVGLCRDCRAYLNQMRITTESLGALPPDPVPEPVMAELKKRFKEWKG